MSEENTTAMDEQVRVTRDFPVELAEGDGRTIEMKVVPYNTPTTVADPPSFKPYVEEWLPGAFDKQTGMAGASGSDRVKVWLNFEHNKGLAGIVGHGVALHDRNDDHLFGVFRVHENNDGDKALQLVRDGLLTGASLEAIAIRSRKTAAGVVQRLRAHLDGVALCRFPAYKDAQVLAVRQEPLADLLADTNQLSNRELEARLTALGVAPLARMSVSQADWDDDPAAFSDEEYERSCLLDRGGTAPVKERCSLPVLEPDGALNVHALAAAGVRIAQASGNQDVRAVAARKLVRLYRIAGLEAPNGVTRIARTQ